MDSNDESVSKTLTRFDDVMCTDSAYSEQRGLQPKLCMPADCT